VSLNSVASAGSGFALSFEIIGGKHDESTQKTQNFEAAVCAKGGAAFRERLDSAGR
jgi:hypothetical protein